MSLALWLLALALPQTTPSGGAIAKFVPPVPTPASFIADERSVLKPDEKSALDARIKAVQAAELGDIAVAILPSIGSYSPNQIGVEIYRTWKVGSVAPIGSARRNVGVLILVVPKELAPDNRGQCYISTGTGAEGIITDAIAGRICRDSMIPHLRERRYAAAIGAGISALEARLRGDSALATSEAPIEESSGGLLAVVSVIGALTAGILGIFGALRWRRYRTRQCPKCRRPMRRLDEKADDQWIDAGARVEEKLGSVDYDVWACECGGTKVIPYRATFTKYSKCKECGRRTASSKQRTIDVPTTTRAGLAQKRFACKACQATWVVDVVLPQITESSSSGGSGGGGGGGGSSFGGSGATSGGGGGSSY